MNQSRSRTTPPNEAMKLTKLSPAPWPVGGAGSCPRRTIIDAGTASQLIASVGPTERAWRAEMGMKSRVLLGVLMVGTVGCGQAEAPCAPYPGVGLIVAVVNGRTYEAI